MPAELGLRQHDLARLGVEGGVLERLDELPATGQAEVAALVLAARVGGELRRELREAALVGLHLSQDVARLRLLRDQDVPGADLVELGQVLVVEGLDLLVRDLDVLGEGVAQLHLQHDLAGEARQVLRVDAAGRRLLLELLLTAGLLGELGDLRVDLTVGDLDALVLGRLLEQLGPHQAVEHLALVLGAVGAELLLGLRVGQAALDERLEVVGGDALVADGGSGSGARLAAAAASGQEEHGEAGCGQAGGGAGHVEVLPRGTGFG